MTEKVGIQFAYIDSVEAKKEEVHTYNVEF